MMAKISKQHTVLTKSKVAEKASKPEEEKKKKILKPRTIIAWSLWNKQNNSTTEDGFNWHDS